MRHAAIAVMCVGLAVLTLAGAFVMSASVPDEWNQGGYVLHESQGAAFEYALERMAVMDSIAREDSLFLRGLDARADEHGFNIDEECGQ